MSRMPFSQFTIAAVCLDTGMASSTKLWIWKNVPGIAGRCNDIIFKASSLVAGQDILVYFGGDVQDFEKSMLNHADSKKYSEWCLENTARILSSNFPSKDILVVRPFRMHITFHAAFSCFDNFVAGKHTFGVPTFQPNNDSLKHLRELLRSSLQQLKACSTDENIVKYNLENVKLTLMGFSKGCVVLNQFLHELHHYQEKLEQDPEIYSFIKQIQSMWWLDGGHGGSKDTWITDKQILQSFAKLSIPAHVHVTPFQIEDSHRPWIRHEEETFCDILRELGVPLEQTVHFADLPHNLTSHFNVLKAVSN